MNPQKKSSLSATQKKLLIELVKTPDVTAAATAAGVARSTVYRWMENPEFTAQLSKLRDESMRHALESIKSQTERAAIELIRLMDTQDERLRRMLCNDILNHAATARKLDRLEKWLTQM